MASSNTDISTTLSTLFQEISDHWLAWQLQAEEYKSAWQVTYQDLLLDSSVAKKQESLVYEFHNQGNPLSFTSRSTLGDRDCFFHAVHVQNFNRDTLVKKLLENSADKTVLSIFAHEIRQFLYLGYTGSHSDKQENEACQQLLTLGIKYLFSTIQDAEKVLTLKVVATRTALGALETHGKRPEELLELLRQRNPNLSTEFEQAYNVVLKIDKAIYEYCCQSDIFEQYVKLYLQNARGYIPFSREFGTEVPQTTIDVINQLFQLKIQVYLPHKINKDQLVLANQLQQGKIIHILHNGINHFSGLEPQLKNVEKRGALLYMHGAQIGGSVHAKSLDHSGNSSKLDASNANIKGNAVFESKVSSSEISKNLPSTNEIENNNSNFDNIDCLKNIPNAEISILNTAIGGNLSIYQFLLSESSSKEIDETLKSSLREFPYCKEREYLEDELKLYIPPFCCDPMKDPYAISLTEDSLPALRDKVEDFLFRREERVLLLKGEAGTGKTLFGCYLEKYFWENFKNPCDPILFFIYLPDFQDPTTNLLTDYFEKKFGKKESAILIEKLKQRTKVYFILDAYDEIPAIQQNLNKILNLYDTNNLFSWKNAKFIITCRTTLLEKLLAGPTSKSLASYFAPLKDELYRTNLPVLQIALFNNMKINEYIDSYVKSDAENHLIEVGLSKRWNVSKYKEAIERMRNKIEKVIRNPLHLKMTTRALPIIVDWYEAGLKNDSEAFLTLTERDVFLAYLKYSLMRQENKLKEPPQNLKTAFLSFLLNLVFVMMTVSKKEKREISTIQCKFIQGKYEGPLWAINYFGNPFVGQKDEGERLKELEMIRSNLTSLLMYEHKEGKWRFIHDSFKSLIASINLVELTALESRNSDKIEKKEKRGKSIEEFSRLLFEDPQGPFLTGRQEWVSSAIKRKF